MHKRFIRPVPILYSFGKAQGDLYNQIVICVLKFKQKIRFISVRLSTELGFIPSIFLGQCCNVRPVFSLYKQ